MNKKKTIIVWMILEDEGYWTYLFGNKEGTLSKSGKFMTKALAQKALNNEIDLAKKKFGEEWEVLTEELKS